MESEYTKIFLQAVSKHLGKIFLGACPQTSYMHGDDAECTL